MFLANSTDSVGTTVGNTTEETVDAVTTWWQDDTTREWLVAKPTYIIVILVMATIAHWLLHRVINKVAQQAIDKGGTGTGTLPIKIGRSKSRRKRREQEEQLEALDQAHENRRVSRIKTLAGVGRSAAAIIVWVMAFLLILDQLGVNIAPLIASAGVVGVALGFGAQSLVKDFLSGIFMLLEDQYGIGDTIDVGNGVVGDVEDITLRITTVRDIDGALWYIRNGEILQVANHTDKYSIARMQIPVGLSNNADDAKRVLTESAIAASRDEAISTMCLDTPEMLGITDFQPDYVSYRLQVKTLPGDQWTVQRFIQARIWEDMQEQGITTPYPHGKGIGAIDNDDAAE